VTSVKRLLLTGATGMVGQYLLRDLLLGGASLAVVIRAQGGATARARLHAILTHWEKGLGRPLPRPVCLEGDITREGLGLTREAQAWVSQHCDSMLHNAASLTFVGGDRGKDPWLSNVTGARNVLEFCRQTGLRELHHVSTAYVCGQRTGAVLEQDLDCGQAFRNDYEHSKCEGEKLVRAASFLDRLTVYRPSVIMGDWHTGYTGAYHGLYAYFQFAQLALEYFKPQADGRYHVSVRLGQTGEERCNLVPVDWVSAVIAHLVRSPAHHGRTYHLTSPSTLTAREIDEAMASYFHYSGTVFVGPEALHEQELNTMEAMFYGYVARYQPYWADHPRFDCSNTQAAAGHLPCPVIDGACLHRLLDFAVADHWGKSAVGQDRVPAGAEDGRETGRDRPKASTME
jgi:thioester reductase-like protein